MGYSRVSGLLANRSPHEPAPPHSRPRALGRGRVGPGDQARLRPRRRLLAVQDLRLERRPAAGEEPGEPRPHHPRRRGGLHGQGPQQGRRTGLPTPTSCMSAGWGTRSRSRATAAAATGSPRTSAPWWTSARFARGPWSSRCTTRGRRTWSGAGWPRRWGCATTPWKRPFAAAVKKLLDGYPPQKAEDKKP